MSIENLVMPDLKKEIGAYADKIVPIMQEEVHHRSGRLASCIESEKISETEYRVGVNGERLKAESPEHYDYSLVYYNGRGPVRPKRAKALRWVDENGNVHFSKYVRGTKGDPFLPRVMARLPEI